ncbi:MAG: bifunctional oligoribonuclease/PAP phosphatase NrnA [Lachnospiraceae bacterium]|nr:bifunctional oligoribonuclease/PAP phosphatase NrnA [Lachnospiraceae bacterium]
MKIYDEVKNAASIAVSGHVNPDGDAAGATAAMYLFLKKAVPGAKIVAFCGEMGDTLRENLPAAEEFCFDGITDVEKFDVFICLDTADDRLGAAQKYFHTARKTVNIDHHRTNTGCGDVNYIVPTASSTCELVYNVIDDSLIDEPIARALYIGIITDTGVFKYSNTSPRTMEIAGCLMSHGVDTSTLIDDVFYRKSYLENQILGRALLESVLFRDGTCIFSVLNRQTMDFYGVGPKNMEGIVSQLMLTEGVKCAIFMYETEPLTYKVSMRSNGEINVADIAAFYGGGGHSRAAGCTVNATYRDIINNISDSIDIQMRRSGETAGARS